MPHVNRFHLLRSLSLVKRFSSTRSADKPFQIGNDFVEVNGKKYQKDKLTNVTPNILGHLQRNLHLQEGHPLSLLRQNIVNFMYGHFINRSGNPLFSVYDRLSPVVSTTQNFDSLLIPQDHPSRSKSDCYYLNSDYLLRGHTSAHQHELIAMGLDNFLVVGDVYRRDEIDSSHYPVFHQMEGVRLFTRHELFGIDCQDELKFFEDGKRSSDKQQTHTLEAVKLLEHNLKSCLSQLVQRLFGPEIELRWVDTYFPFTHPSYELEVKFQGKWLELLGCGIIEQKMLENAGVPDKVGWAFGLGLERLAMRMYDIPDIRLFWSRDSGFLSQFEGAAPETRIKYKPVSQYPQCFNDLSFWLPDNSDFSSTDFFEIVRSSGGHIVEQVKLIDEFTHPKSKRRSQCYRIVYRHMERTLTQEEVNEIHKEIEKNASAQLGVTIR